LCGLESTRNTPKPFLSPLPSSTAPAIKTSNRQLYAVPELKLKQDGNSGSALHSNFCAWRKKQKQIQKRPVGKKKKSLNLN